MRDKKRDKTPGIRKKVVRTESCADHRQMTRPESIVVGLENPTALTGLETRPPPRSSRAKAGQADRGGGRTFLSVKEGGFSYPPILLRGLQMLVEKPQHQRPQIF
ncbi:MAG TPA: hypothetical protein VGH65_04135, partial [Verrucomicrobiaceae bacterium]